MRESLSGRARDNGFLSTVIFCICVGGTGAVVAFGAEYLTGVPITEILSWWWREGEGRVPVIVMSSLLFFFAVLLSLWAMAWTQILRGELVPYVWLGPDLINNKGYYYATDDPTRERVTLRVDRDRHGFNYSSSIDSLFLTHTMIRFGPRPEQIGRAMEHGLGPQIKLALFQYVTLLFGVTPVGHVVYQYVQAHGLPSAAPAAWNLAAIVLGPLFAVQVLGLVTGDKALKKKLAAFPEKEYVRVHDTDLKPGDTVTVTLKKKGRERRKSGNKPFDCFYLVEWASGPALTVSAVFAFHASRKIKEKIDELDRLTERQSQIGCRVDENFKLRPTLFDDVKDPDWI